MKSHQVTALVLGILFLLGQLDAVYCSDRKGDRDFWRYVKCGVVGAAAGGVAVAGAPYILPAVGFTQTGIASGSVAAKLMSVSAVANGGGVASGGLVATLQSAGTAGVGATAIGTTVMAGSDYLCDKLFGEE